MNAAEQPIILAGTTESGTRYVQFWTESEKIAGREVAVCRAEMADGDAYAPNWLTIKRGCPPIWVERVLTLFPVFFTGGDVKPTHTVTWIHSVPTFHPIAQPPVNGGLFDLEEVDPCD